MSTEVKETQVVIKKGNIFSSEMLTLTNAVNCVGVMGAGVAAGFKSAFPLMYIDYVDKCEEGKVKLGEPYLYEHLPEFKKQNVLNFPTMHDPGEKASMETIEIGFKHIKEQYGPDKIGSLAVPALGCGVGGLDFDTIKSGLVGLLDDLGIMVELYEPLG